MQKLSSLLLCIVIYTFSFNHVNAQCNNGRYYSSIFSVSSTPTTVVYGNAVLYNGVDTNLKVDIYQPNNDPASARPLLVFAFGGSFTAGLRQSPDLVTLCTYFAQRGYVCASIDYRLGYNGSGTDTNLFTAMIRGVQDMKAAVRFFYKDASTANQFRIDTDQIFIGGVSAGAFMALNYAYWDFSNFSKVPPGFVIPIVSSLGGMDGNSGNPGYSQKIKGVIDLCGGLADTVWLTPTAPILVGVHGTADGTVACSYDSAYSVINPKSMLFGGCDIKERLSNINTVDSMYLFQGANHCPFILPADNSLPSLLAVPKYMDTTEWIIRDFLVKHVTCPQIESGVNDLENNISVTIYPNPAQDAMFINSQNDKDLTMSVLSMDGKLIQQHLLAANTAYALQKQDLSAGVYLLQFTEKNSNRVLKTEKVVFY